MPNWCVTLCAVPLLALGAAASAQDLQQVDADPRLQRCLMGMLSGYATGLDETSCRSLYDLPSPFTFKCLRRIRTGFDSETQRTACAAFLGEAQTRAAMGYVRPAREGDVRAD